MAIYPIEDVGDRVGVGGLDKLWYFERSHLRCDNMYIGGGLERIPVCTSKRQYVDWMNVKLEKSQWDSQEIQTWKDSNNLVYFQATGSNFWLTKLAWNENLGWLDSDHPQTAFHLIPAGNFRAHIDAIRDKLINLN